MTHSSEAFEFRHIPGVAAWLAAAAVALCSASAEAEPTYPGIIKEVTGTPCEPPCILCHQTNAPTSLVDAPVPNAGRPFYDALLGLGFRLGADQLKSALKVYLDTYAMDPTTLQVVNVSLDVNNNGANDVAVDLPGNVNPNDDSDLCEIPKYGCGASRIEPRGDVEDYGVFLSAFAMMTLLLRTRRRRPAKRRPG